MKPQELASYIDHTLLKPDCIEADMYQLCQEAMQFGFAAVCVPPFYVNKAFQWLNGEEALVRVATVVGFPFGYSSTPAKVEEIKRALDDGAEEVDAVINLCAVKSQQWSYVQNDIESMCTAARLRGKKIKIILETGVLKEGEIRRLMDILLISEPDFVKTSTGFNGGGATLEAVRLLHELAAGKMGIKASGDIHSLEQALAFIDAGASRIGTSSAVSMMQAL